MAKTNDRELAPELWDLPAPILGYIDPEAARQERRAQQAQRLRDIQAITQMVSGHSMHLEIMSATVEGDEIQMAGRWHGQVQRPGVIARPSETGVVQIRLKATVEQPAEEQAPETRTTADRIQQRSDLR